MISCNGLEERLYKELEDTINMFYRRKKQLFYTIPWNIFQKRFKNYKFESQITQVNVVKGYQETECKTVERGKDIKGAIRRKVK